MSLSPVLIAAPAKQPVTLAEVKQHCRIEDDIFDDDEFLKRAISTIVSLIDGVEGALGRALITQQWKIYLDCWSRCIRLPLSPVQTVQSVTYFDSSNVSQTFASANYSLLTDNDGSFLSIPASVALPSLYMRQDAIAVTFTAGYGDEPDDIPASLRSAIAEQVCSLYENRESIGDKDLVAIPGTASDALYNHRARFVF